MSKSKVKEHKDKKSYIGQDILLQLDPKTLSNAEKVSQSWRGAIVDGKLFERLFNRNVS